MMESIRVKFLVNRVVRDFRAGTPDEESYEAGKIYDLPVSSANHWLGRGYAEEAPAEEPKPKPRTRKAKDDAPKDEEA